MTEYTTRTHIKIILPLNAKTTLAKPELMFVKFSNDTHYMDVGRWCYLKRKKSTIGGRPAGAGCYFPVKQSTLCVDRRKTLRKLIRLMSDTVALKLKRPQTLVGEFRNFLRFLDWADRSRQTFVLEDKLSTLTVLQRYIDYLKHKVNIQELALTSAVIRQHHIFSVLKLWFEDDALSSGMRLFISRRTISSEVVDTRDQQRALMLYSTVFTGLCDLVLNPSQYPFHLHLTDYSLWLFPCKKSFMNPQECVEQHRHIQRNWQYDYVNGRLGQQEEVADSYSHRYTYYDRRRKAQAQLDEANQDPQHRRRREHAHAAAQVFAHWFIAVTGINPTQACQLTWNGSFEIEVAYQGFRAIKWRANGRLVEFHITVNFLSVFKRYLMLRNYLLQGKEIEFLFLNAYRYTADLPRQLIAGHAATGARDILARFDPTVTWISPRQWRAVKSDFHLRKHDVSVAAIALQNTERTVLKSYATGSSTAASKEMTDYFEHVATSVLSPNSPTPSRSVPSSIGSCSDYKNPQRLPLDNDVLIPTDCTQPEGCLFCEHYTVHADNTDVRKLLSCRYCINYTMPLSHNMDHFDSLFKPVIQRIDTLVNQIASFSSDSAQMVEAIRIEVDAGELDLYWGKKLEMLIQLGVVTE